MASSRGVMGDFARLPTQSKVLVFVVIGGLLALLYWQFVYKSLGGKLDDARIAAKQKATKNQQLDKDLKDYEDKQVRYPELLAKNVANQKALPVDADRPALWDMLGPKIAQAGVQFISSDDKAESTVENFIRVPVEVTINGTFMQIKRFFASLTQANIGSQAARGDKKDTEDDRERIISIDSLAISQPVVRDREVYLTARFTATTFRQVEKKEPAKPGQPAAAPGTVPGATPPAPANTGAPPPSPNSPAGVGQKVQGNIDTKDARDRNAQGINEAKTPDSTKGSAAGSGSGAARLKGGQ
jgi:Tfp pilus assembly protein PilO